MTEKKRIAYLDMAKGIGMILVVMGHVEYIDVAVRQFIFAFHMPLFFLIAGILIWEKQEAKKNVKELVQKKLRSIMVPYVAFSALYFVVEGCRLAIRGLEGWDTLIRQLFQACCLQGVSTLWFLPALFMSELLFIGLRKKHKPGWTVGLVCAIVLLTFCLQSVEAPIYEQHAQSLAYGMLHDVLSMLLRNLFCVGFVCIGYYVGKLLLPRLQRGWLELVVALSGLGFTFVIVMCNFDTNLRYMQLGNLFLYIAGAVAGSMAAILGCRFLEGLPLGVIKRPLEYYGRNSLIIMVTHLEFRVLYCSIRLAELLSTIWNQEVLFQIQIVVFVFVLEIPVIWFINRFMPFLLGKRVKNS